MSNPHIVYAAANEQQLRGTTPGFPLSKSEYGVVRKRTLELLIDEAELLLFAIATDTTPGPLPRFAIRLVASPRK